MIDRTVLSPYNEAVQIDGMEPPKNSSPGSNKIITREVQENGA
jgi:hypothetical protein